MSYKLGRPDLFPRKAGVVGSPSSLSRDVVGKLRLARPLECGSSSKDPLPGQVYFEEV